MRPFEGVKILDCTHVLAGPFAAYQLAVLGADVIKVDDPNEPDQSRESGADHALNKADVLVENYRPGAFKALGLGYEDLSRLNPKLVYASMTAFGQDGPRGAQTAYDHAIQATSGITASTGTETSGPIKAGAPMIDYATGTMGAFAISAALYQCLRTGRGQYIDLAMFDVAMIMQASHITDFLHSGHHPRRAGNKMRFAASSAFPTKDGLVQLAASNARQHRRFYEAIGDPDEARRASLEERYERYEEKLAAVAEKMKEKTADEWEAYFQSRHVPATRVRELREALADPQLDSRRVLHRHETVPGIGKPLTVPLAAFKFAHDGPSIERPPAAVGEHTDEVLKAIGYDAEKITALRKAGAVA